MNDGFGAVGLNLIFPSSDFSGRSANPVEERFHNASYTSTSQHMKYHYLYSFIFEEIVEKSRMGYIVLGLLHYLECV